MASTNYSVNYDDKRFTDVENEKQEALTEVEQTYGDMTHFKKVDADSAVELAESGEEE